MHNKITSTTIYFFILTFFILSSIEAQNKLNPQKVTFDLPTAHTLSMVVPTLEGDANRNGVIEVFFRADGKGEWEKSMSLYRNNNGKGSSQSFAGMLFDLKADTTYEIKLVANDPDGVEGEVEQIVNSRTKKIPVRIKADGAVEVSNYIDLLKAINDAGPGTVILMNKGVYEGKVSISNKSGMEEKPIVIRGKSRSDCIIKGTFTIENGKFIHVENMTIFGGDTGFYLSKCDSVVIRDNLILKVNLGVYAKGGHTNLYIENNAVIGNNVFGDVSKDTWNDEGIVVTGMGIEVANNTLAGFGDSIGMSNSTSIKNRAIDMHHNMVVWGGDDGVEMDFADRNVQAHHNLFTNTANGISCQMVWNGPVYLFKNVMYNVNRGPYKIKPERAPNDGLFIMNNTSIISDMAFLNYSTAVDGLYFVNNLFVGKKNKSLLMLGSNGDGIRNLVMDYNAWSYDGSFSIPKYGNASNFQDWKTKHSQGNHDVLLAGQKIFDQLTLDINEIDFFSFRNPHQNFSLEKSSAAIDAGIFNPGINSKFIGKAPDIGAWELGETTPLYGAFKEDITPPSSPGNIKANSVSISQIDLTWEPALDAESGVMYYVVYRNSKTAKIVMGSNSFSETNLEEATEYTYDVVAVNGRILESNKINAIKISTLSDLVLPEVTVVNAFGPNNQVILSFNKKISKESAENKDNYKLDSGIVIESAVLQKNNTNVILTTTALKKDSTYHLTIKNILDQAKKPNRISDSTKKVFQFKELKTFINFGTNTLGVNGFDKLLKDKDTNFIKDGLGGTSPVAKINPKDANFQGVVSKTPRAFIVGEEIYVTWYNNSKTLLTFTPKISFTHNSRPNKGEWYDMTAVSIAPSDTGTTVFKFSDKTAGNFTIVNVGCNVQTNANALICNKIELDSK